MTKLLLIRHGEPDYSHCDERGYIGHGRDLAPLTEAGVLQAENTAKDERLTGASIILASPYTRALQTAAIISKQTGLDIKVEMDLHEWMPDTTFQYSTFSECLELNKDFDRHKGVYPEGETRKWESVETLRNRVRAVLNQYVHYDQVIVVCHGMVIRTLKYQENIAPGELIELEYAINDPDAEYVF